MTATSTYRDLDEKNRRFLWNPLTQRTALSEGERA